MGRTLTAVNLQSATSWIAQLPPGRSQYTPPLGLYWQPISGSTTTLTEKTLGGRRALHCLCRKRAHAWLLGLAGYSGLECTERAEGGIASPVASRWSRG